MKAFLSSTFKDLEQHRAAVIARLRRLDGMEVRCMEDFGARAGSPKDFCVREARDCDLFIGIIGHLYGFIPDGDKTSITEQEYHSAEAGGRDMLFFVAPDDLSVPAKLLRNDSDPDRQEAFRDRVLARNVVNLDWSTPETLASGVVEAVHNWSRQRSGDAMAPAIPGIDLGVYIQRCRKRWEVMDLSTLAAPGSLDGDVELPKLSQVFIPQACRRSRPAVSLPRDYLERQGLDPDEEERLLGQLRERWRRQERLPALALVGQDDARKLVLLGDPGAGKSSLTRYVLLRLLDRTPPGEREEWRSALEGTLPVLVELRDLLAREVEGRCTDLLSYIAYTGETQGFGFDRAALETQLRDRPTLIIVDGLDEIFSVPRRRAMVEEIVGLESRFPLARVLVTSRIAGFDARPLESAGFTVATLDDLDDQQIGLFTDTWFGLAFPAEPEKANRARDDLLEALKRRPQIAVLAGNPLILTIMAIIARHKRLARSRTQIYAQALEVLCYAWDYRRGLQLPADSPLADLQPEDTLFMLRRIAWRMQESADGLRANAITEGDLRSILDNFFGSEWRFPPPRARRAAAEMVRLLQERNWILTMRGPELYGFVHRTFLEYLVALELTKQFEAQEITLEVLRDTYVLPHVDDDSYSEVIRLLCGQLTARAVDQLIQAITPSPERALSHEHRLLLAWQALGELDPRSLASATAACDAALRGIYGWVKRCDFKRGELSANAFVEAVNVIEPGSWPATTVQAEPLPISDAHDPFRSEPLNCALAKTVWLPHPSFRQSVLALLESSSWNKRRGGVRLLGPEILHDSRIYEILERLAVEDAEGFVRVGAMQTLAERFLEQSDVANIMTTNAEDSPITNAGVAAVETLVGSCRKPAEVCTFLRSRAWADKSGHVRGMALYYSAKYLDSAPLRQLLSADFDDLAPGIDPLVVIDSYRVSAAAEEFGEHVDTIRAHYESLVREHGFPLRLEWLENEEAADPPSAA